jgi:hypothetical protein
MIPHGDGTQRLAVEPPPSLTTRSTPTTPSPQARLHARGRAEGGRL